MPSIDERVVSIAFENSVFESRVATTMATLTKLDASIKKIGTTNGLQNIESAANKVTLQQPMSALDKLKAKFSTAGSGAAQGLGQIDQAGNKVTLEGPSRAADKLQTKMNGLSAGTTFSNIERDSNQVTLSGLSRTLDNVSAKFSVLEGAASVALGNIASKAAMKSANFAKSFAIGPIIDGLHEYETNLKAIQTVQANTDQPLTKINKSMTELNQYSDRTIYNFGEMAKNIGTFTAAGVDLKTATSSIKGIANLAALSGSSSQQASTAMYQLSQAISSGKVGLQDWNSVVNAGMGGKKLQNALAQTGVAMGKIGANSVKLEGPMKKLTINGQSFRESIMAGPGKQSWLESDILVNTLATLDGRFSKVALSTELTKDGLKKYTKAEVEAKIAASRTALEQKNGVKYTDEQFKALMKLSDSAFKSATEVKTLGQVFDIAKETLGSGWSASFQSIFGTLGEAKKTFTQLSTTINGFINANALARNKVLHDWKAMGGRTELIEGIKQAFENVMLILRPIKEAFRDIFPAQTGKSLLELTKSFSQLMDNLRPTPAVVSTIRHVFSALFAVFHIGFAIAKGVAGVIFDLLGVMGHGSGGVMAFVRSFSDFVVGIDKALTEGGLLNGFFKGLTTVLRLPLQLLKSLASAFASLFKPAADGLSAGDQADQLKRFGKVLTPLEKLIINIKNAWANLSQKFGEFKKMMEPWFSQMVEKFRGFGDILGEAFKNMDFDKIMKVVQTGLIAGLLVTLKKALGEKGVISALTGALDSVNKVMGGLTGNLEAMQKKVQAQTILTIAAAIVALAGGIYILSTIDPDKLGKAMVAVAIGLGELTGAMKLMMAGMGKLGFLQLPVIAASMIGLAIAITILAGAMKIFATMSWEDIAKGLIGVAGSIAGIGLALNLVGGPKMMATALALIPLAIGINLIAAAVKVFASMSWEDLGKGLLGMASAIALIGNALLIMPPTMPITAAGLVLMGVALGIIAAAVKSFGEMDILTMTKGLGAMTLAIAGIGVAMWLVPPTIALTAGGILIMAGAMVVLGKALSIMGGLGILTLVKGITAMAASLVVLAIGLALMSGTLAGSVALMAAAVALGILAPTLAFLGTLSWGTIFKGLAAIALALGTLAVVGAIAAAPLASLGFSLLPLAGAFVLTAAAVFLFAKAMALLGADGGKGIAVMVTAITAFIALIPTIAIQLVKGILDTVQEVVKLAPQVLAALGKMVDMLIAFVIQNAPKLALAIGVLVDSILQVLLENAPKIQAAGFKLFLGLLNGLSANITQITTKVGEIVTKFLNAMTAQMPRIVSAGFNLLNKFLNGIISNLPRLVATVGTLITTFINNVAANIPRVVGVAGRLIIRFINAVSSQSRKIIDAGVNLILNLMDGIGDAIPRLVAKGLEVARKFVNGLADGMSGLARVGFRAIIRFLNGLEQAIRDNFDDLFSAGAGVADAIIDGLVDQFGKLGGLLRRVLEAVFSKLPGWAKRILGIQSPSTVFAEIGKFTMLGFAKGIENGERATNSSIDSAAKNIVKTAKGTLDKVPSLIEGMMDTDPVISPVLDLGQVERESRKLNALTNVVPITAAASFNQAQAIAQTQETSDAVAEQAPQGGVTFKFEQHNSSPESLSTVEVYRQTNNLLSQTKSVLEGKV